MVGNYLNLLPIKDYGSIMSKFIIAHCFYKTLFTRNKYSTETWFIIFPEYKSSYKFITDRQENFSYRIHRRLTKYG